MNHMSVRPCIVLIWFLFLFLKDLEDSPQLIVYSYDVLVPMGGKLPWIDTFSSSKGTTGFYIFTLQGFLWDESFQIFSPHWS